MQGHRERLRQRFAADAAALTDEELLELLLTYAVPQRDLGPAAQALLDHFGALSAVLAASAAELESVAGVGAASAGVVRLAAEVARRVAERRPAAESSVELAALAPEQLVDEPAAPVEEVRQDAEMASRQTADEAGQGAFTANQPANPTSQQEATTSAHVAQTAEQADAGDWLFSLDAGYTQAVQPELLASAEPAGTAEDELHVFVNNEVANIQRFLPEWGDSSQSRRSAPIWVSGCRITRRPHAGGGQTILSTLFPRQTLEPSAGGVSASGERSRGAQSGLLLSPG